MDRTPNPMNADEVRTTDALRRHAPRPDPEFVAGLGAELFPVSRARRPALFAGILATALATASILLLGILGTGPLAPGGDESVNASDRACRKTLAGTRKAPELVRAADGRWQIRYRLVPVKRRSSGC